MSAIAVASLGPGDRIGPYVVRRRLGGGGMGAVFHCEAVEACAVPAGRAVAIKVLRSSNDAEDRRRFVREARYLQSLQHPGIVRLLDTGEHDGHPYIVMPYIAGHPVDDLVREGGRVDERRAAAIAAQALEALHAAHLAGILHRDLKPGNLMLDDDGRVLVLDFGLAAGPMGESRLTATGDVLGTPVYMSPEQAAGLRDRISPRSDVYSVGACLYELLTGRAPFEADNSIAVLRRIIDDPLEPPARLRPGLARELETVVLMAMAKDPRDRYSSAGEMAIDLRRFLSGRRVRGRRPGWGRSAWRGLVRHRRLAATIGLAAFIALAASGLAVRRVLQARHAIPDPRTWVEERRYDGGDLIFTPAPTFGPGSELATLLPVAGPVRLGLSLTIAATAAGGPAAELMVSDPDIGRGYRLRLELGTAAGEGGGDRLLLLRQDRLMASRDLPLLPRGRPLHLHLEHDDVDLRAMVRTEGSADPPVVLRFLDLAPVQGASATGLYLVRQAGAVAVGGAVVERHRGGEFVSALALADDRRQEGNYARAAVLYQEFLAQYPDSPQAADARLRLAVCQAAMPATLEQAYASFLAAAAGAGVEPAYAMVATFQAWACALRLNRYEEAEALFDTIRSTYDLPTLAAAVPEQTLRQVSRDYAARAERLEADDPERAIRLYLNSAEIGGFLDGSGMAQGLLSAGDLLMGLGRSAVAQETYRRVAEDSRLDEDARIQGRFRMAEAQRLLGDVGGAAASYGYIIDDIWASRSDVAWARLWLGDLWCQHGRVDQAVAQWREGMEGGGLPSRIMRVLAQREGRLPPAQDRAAINDIDYFTGRLAWLKGDLGTAGDWFQRVASGSRPQDWPAPLARALIAAAPR